MSDISFLRQTKSVHVIGAGLNQERPAHRAFIDMKGRGYRMVPVHPRDAGSTIQGVPILPNPWASVDPELFVIFLSPERTLGLLRKWVVANRNAPFIWLQPGAESDDVLEFLNEAGMPHSSGKCWVVTCIQNDISCEDPLPKFPWVLQTTSTDGDHCSVWRFFPPGTDLKLDEPLEWVGDLMDLQSSDERIPRYVRSLRHDGESLLETAQRLAIQPN
jgi:predicted CoA-binding protein